MWERVAGEMQGQQAQRPSAGAAELPALPTTNKNSATPAEYYYRSDT